MWGGCSTLVPLFSGPRALFAQQHVVPQEGIKPALKVQGTAKLCWEVERPAQDGAKERVACRLPP